MTLIPKTSLIVDPDGESANFKDITGATSETAYGQNGNNDYADIDAVRIKIARFENLLSDGEILAADDEFTQFAEYLKIAGASETINGKTFIVGAYFVPQVASLTTALDDAWQATGYYVPQILATWLPTAAEVALNLDLDELNQSDNTYVAGDGYTYDYETYDNVHTSNFAATDEQTYMVLLGTCTYGGSSYIAGEIFTANDTGTITCSASNKAVELYSTKTFYSLMAYETYQNLYNLALEAESGSCQRESEFKLQLTWLRIYLEALSNMCATANVSMEATQVGLEKINSQVTILQNWSA